MTFAQMLQAILQNTPTMQNPSALKLPENLTSRLENIGAFRGKPAYRYILTAILRTNLTEILTDKHAPAEETRHSIERFITHTGFQPQLVYAITEAIASASGLTEYPTFQKSPSNTRHQQSLTSHEIITHLNTILHINRETEAARGVALVNPAITAITQPTSTTSAAIKLTATLKRTRPDGSANLHYALYATTSSESGIPLNPDQTETTGNQPNTPMQTINPSSLPLDISRLTLLSTGIADTFTIQSPSPHPLTATIPCDPSAITHILLYLD